MQIDFVDLIVGAVVALLAYFGKRELGRKDEDIRNLVRRLDTHITECSDHQQKNSETLTQVRESVARIEGMLDK